MVAKNKESQPKNIDMNIDDSSHLQQHRTMDKYTTFGSILSIPSLMDGDAVYGATVVGEEESFRCHSETQTFYSNRNLEKSRKRSCGDGLLLEMACDDDSVPSLVDEKSFDEDVNHNLDPPSLVDEKDFNNDCRYLGSHEDMQPPPPRFGSSDSVEFVVNHIIKPKYRQMNYFEEQHEDSSFSQYMGVCFDRIDESLLSLSSMSVRPFAAESDEIPIEIVVSCNHQFHSASNAPGLCQHHSQFYSETTVGLPHLNVYHMEDGWDLATYTSQDIDVDIPLVLEQLVGTARPTKKQKTMENASVISSLPESSVTSSSCHRIFDFQAISEQQWSSPIAPLHPQPCLSSSSVNSSAFDLLVDDSLLDAFCVVDDPSLVIPHVYVPVSVMQGGSDLLQSPKDAEDDIPSIPVPLITSMPLTASADAATTKRKKRRRQSKRPNYEPSVKIYVVPNDNDVLLGRGGRTNHHPGNHMYLEEKKKIQPRYLAATKEEKTGISQELVDAVHSWGGRFLKQDPVEANAGSEDNELDTESETEHDDSRWYEVLNIVARKKASQTLREVSGNRMVQ